MDFVDIFLKADVVRHLKDLVKAGQVRECLHLKVEKGYVNAFYSECDVEWARAVPADNVVTDDMASHAPSSYDWPACPTDCPKFLETPNFVWSLTESTGPPQKAAPADAYVHPDRIRQLKSCKSSQYDLAKLVAFCEELNTCHQANQVLAVPMLVRAILDHVAPVLGCKSFAEVANNYAGSKSFREGMGHLDNTSRKIADSFLHTQVRSNETLPTTTQVDFRNSLDMLLQEIVRVLK